MLMLDHRSILNIYILLLNTSSELMSLISISFMSPSIHPSEIKPLSLSHSSYWPLCLLAYELTFLVYFLSEQSYFISKL